MSIKFLSGCEYQNRTDEGLSSHATDNLVTSTFIPATTNGARSFSHISVSTGIYSAPLTSSVSQCWTGFQAYANTGATEGLIGVSSGSATRFVEAGFVAGEWAIYVNGSAASTSSGASLNTWHRLHVHIAGITAGSVISLYKAGDLSSPLVQYTLTGGDVSGWPAAFSDFCLIAENGLWLDDMWLMDPSDATGVTDPQETLSFSVELLPADADGADFTFATGSFSDVDEIPFSLADKITADAVGQIADLSFTSATAAQVIGAIKVTQRTQRSGTTAGSQAEISIDDGSNNNAIETVTVPGDGYIRTYIADAADGTALEVSKLNASTIQIKTVT